MDALGNRAESITIEAPCPYTPRLDLEFDEKGKLAEVAAGFQVDAFFLSGSASARYTRGDDGELHRDGKVICLGTCFVERCATSDEHGDTVGVNWGINIHV